MHLLVYTVCIDLLTALPFLKLNNNKKCPIQIIVNECTQNPGKSATSWPWITTVLKHFLQIFLSISYGASFGRGSKRLYKWYSSHAKGGRHAHMVMCSYSYCEQKNKNKKFRSFKSKENIHKKERRWAIPRFRLLKPHQ